MFLKLARIFVAPLAAWCALVEVAETVAARNFGMQLDGDWILLVAGSSPSAMGEFVMLYASPLLLSLLLFVALLIVIGYLAFKAPRWLAVVAMIVFAGYAVFNCRTPQHARGWKPLYVAYDTIRGAERYREIFRAGAWTEEREAMKTAASTNAVNVVFVIGESMTTDRMPFFGYPKDVMPRLSAMRERLAISGPYRAWSPYTVNALAAMFICDGEAAAVRYRRSGYRTAFVTSHNRWGRYCSVEFSVFAACHERIYLTEEHLGEPVYDDMLLPHVRRLVSGSEPFALFVHLMGSHFDPKQRVRPGYFTDTTLDDYDRSIRFTDEVLASLIEMLPPDTVMVYLPDHGESTDSGRWRDFSSRALWSVPLIVYPANAPIPAGINLPPLIEDKQ